MPVYDPPYLFLKVVVQDSGCIERAHPEDCIERSERVVKIPVEHVYAAFPLRGQGIVFNKIFNETLNLEVVCQKSVAAEVEPEATMADCPCEPADAGVFLDNSGPDS